MTEFSYELDKSVEGQASHALPLITCSYCQNSRGVPEMTYPWVDFRRLLDSQTEKCLRWGRTRLRGTDPRDLTWEEFQSLKTQIRKVVEAAFPLPPGATFGMFEGKVYARPLVTDFVMPDASTLLARRNVAERLNQLGNNLRVFELKLKQQKDRVEDLVQIWAPPAAKLGPSAQVAWCVHCERGSVRKSDTIDHSSVPAGTHLFVVREGTFSLVLSEKLVRDIESNGFIGLMYHSVASE